jgi:hypothetical protein
VVVHSLLTGRVPSSMPVARWRLGDRQQEGPLAIAVHTFYDEHGGSYALDDDGLVLPSDATETERFEAWRATADAEAFWLLFPGC